MNTPIDSLFDGFRLAAGQACEKRDKYLIIDKVYEHFDELGELPFPDVLQRILALVEEFPELDYGGPGPFGTLIEAHALAQYTPALLESLGRQPSTQVIGWLDRTMMLGDFQNGMGPNPVTPQQYAQALRTAISGTKIAEPCKEFARICLADLRKRKLIAP